MTFQTLTFCYTPVAAPKSWWKWSASTVSSEVLIDDVPLTWLLAAAGRHFLDGVIEPPVSPSEVVNPETRFTAPLITKLPLEMRLLFLDSLLGVSWAEFDGLAAGRVPLALCPVDFDPDCGFSSALGTAVGLVDT